MSKLKYAIEAFKAIPKVIKKTKDFFSEKKGGSPKKKSKEKQVDLNDRKQNNKANTEKKEDKPQGEETTKHRDDINLEREKAANQDTIKATGRSRGGLDKTENASSSTPEKSVKDVDKKLEEISDNSKLKTATEKNLHDSSKSFEERTGDKKIEQILEEGPSKKDKNWQEKVRPNDKSEFKPLDETEINKKVLDLLKEDSTTSLMPNNENTKTLPLNDSDKSKVISMMSGKKEILPEEPMKVPSKIDTYDLVTKNSAAIEAKEQASFFEEIQIDMAANEALTEFETDPEIGGEGDIEFDFD